MFKKLLYNYRMRKLRKYYIDYTMKHSSNSINAFCYERDDGGLDEVAIRYIENICTISCVLWVVCGNAGGLYI